MSKTIGGKPISRRHFVLGSGAAWFAIARKLVGATTLVQVEPVVQFKMIKELHDAVWRSCSPDSRHLCVTYSQQPIERFILKNEGRSRTVIHEPAGKDVLAVTEFGSWRERSIGQLSSQP